MMDWKWLLVGIVVGYALCAFLQKQGRVPRGALGPRDIQADN